MWRDARWPLNIAKFSKMREERKRDRDKQSFWCESSRRHAYAKENSQTNGVAFNYNVQICRSDTVKKRVRRKHVATRSYVPFHVYCASSIYIKPFAMCSTHAEKHSAVLFIPWTNMHLSQFAKLQKKQWPRAATRVILHVNVNTVVRDV